MTTERHAAWYARVLDTHQCLPLPDSTPHPAFRAAFLPTFHHNAIIELRCPEDGAASLTVITTQDASKPFYAQDAVKALTRPRNKRARKRAREQPPAPAPPTFPFPQAWWVLPAKPVPSILFDLTVPVPGDALARWHAALSGLDLLLGDAPPVYARDGMVTFGEVSLPAGAAVFFAWHPEAGTPWERYFTAMLDLFATCTDHPLLTERLSELRRYW